MAYGKHFKRKTIAFYDMLLMNFSKKTSFIFSVFVDVAISHLLLSPAFHEITIL